jgi:hypothetical protein
LLAVVAGGVVGYTAGRKSGSTPRARVKVEFIEPSTSSAPVAPQSRVYLSGKVRGLPADHKLWIVSRIYDRSTDYFIVQGVPVADHDGRWTATDSSVGSAEDYGAAFVFTAVEADESCGELLAVASAAAGDHRLKTMPDVCKRLVPTIAIHIIKKTR